MCNHKCAEVFSLRVLDPFQACRPQQSYCDGSRARGCQGCQCRYPLFPDIDHPCTRCGKYFLALFDALWEVRQRVYKQSNFDSLQWSDLLLLELEIEQKLWGEVFDQSSADPYPYGVGRTETIKYFVDIMSTIADEIIQRELEKIARAVLQKWEQTPRPPSPPPPEEPFLQEHASPPPLPSLEEGGRASPPSCTCCLCNSCSAASGGENSVMHMCL